jgi:predicted ATPase
MYALAHFKGDSRLGRRFSEEALSMAREAGDSGLVVHGLLDATWNALLRGDFSYALACCEELASVYNPAEHRDERFSSAFDPGPTCLGLMGEILWFLGNPDQALTRCEEAVALARGLQSPTTLLIMQLYMAWTHFWRRDLEMTQRLLETARVGAEEVGLGWIDPMADFFAGSCVAQEGKVKEGLESMQRGLAVWKTIGWRVWVPYCSALLADALRLDGRAEEGLKLWEDAHQTVEDNEDMQQEAEMLRIKGELHLALPQPEPREAEAAFHHAVEVARRQEARSYELRATTSLARLLRDTGRSEEAREMLAEIYGWFTEGFDTADLKEAKALLDELGVEE